MDNRPYMAFRGRKTINKRQNQYSQNKISEIVRNRKVQQERQRDQEEL